MKRPTLLYALGGVVFLYAFLQNAWITDDAYITFRSIEQWFAGNGPRWNPHERVQVFTHPLWFLVLSLFRAVSPDVFLNAVLASLLCGLALLGVAALVLRNAERWLLWLLLTVSSKSLMDYMTSGLENPLSDLLISLVWFFLFSGCRWAFFLSAGLLLTCRHDLILLILPVLALVLCQAAKDGTLRRTVLMAVLGMLPFLAWTVFAVIYYGSAFPNSASAKLQTGLPLFPGNDDRGMLWRGIVYFAACPVFDPFIAALAGLGGVAVWKAAPHHKVQFAAFGIGMATYLVYVLTAGGDYMAGRFLTPILILCTFMAATWADTARRYTCALVLCLLAILCMPTAPVKSTRSYTNPNPAIQWVSDERAMYFPATSLHQHLTRTPDQYFRQKGETGQWYEFALRLKHAKEYIAVHGNVGILGYAAGLNKIVVDVRGVTDPLLARLPSKLGCATGHYDRPMPRGYLLSIAMGQNKIEDPEIRELYEHVRRITQGPLFTRERWRSILRLNSPL